MRIEYDLAAAGRCAERWRAMGLSLGFVPTMGALHEGHVSLLARARAECDRLVASIFVNPTQFAPTEDLASYPVTTEKDLEACRLAGVDLVLLGQASDLYAPGFRTWVSVEGLTAHLCGASRPTHFRGVATIVAILLGGVRPHRAYFGLKDYQQYRVIERAARDLHWGVEIVPCPTVREPDGLAKSSRNAYLDPATRAAAPRLREGLLRARALFEAGERGVERLRECVAEHVASSALLKVDYIEVVRADDLEPFADGTVSAAPAGVLVAAAVRAGKARLIDNIVLGGED